VLKFGDNAWEHEPPSSFHETTVRPSLGLGGGFCVNRSACRRLAVNHCTCPKYLVQKLFLCQKKRCDNLPLL
jgi:hypothetical protein